METKNRLGFQAIDFYRVFNPIAKQKSIFGFSFNTPVINQVITEKPVKVITENTLPKVNGLSRKQYIYSLKDKPVSELKAIGIDLGLKENTIKGWLNDWIHNRNLPKKV